MAATTWRNHAQLALMAVHIPTADPAVAMEHAVALAASISWTKQSGQAIRLAANYLAAQCPVNLAECLNLMRSGGIPAAEYVPEQLDDFNSFSSDAHESALEHKLDACARVEGFAAIAEAILANEPVVLKIGMLREGRSLQTTTDNVPAFAPPKDSEARYGVVAGLRWNIRLREWTLQTCFLEGQGHGDEGWCYLREPHFHHMYEAYRVRMHVVAATEEPT